MRALRSALVGMLLLALPPGVFGVGAVAQPALDVERFEAALATPSTRYAEPIRAVYVARAYRPVWTAGSGLSPHGLALRAAIMQADTDGLDPLDYPLLAPVEGRAREAVEVACARALLQFTADLARGRVDPARVHRDWEASRRQIDRERVLRLAASRGPEAALQAARPPHAGYARLRYALAHYRALADEGEWPTIPPGPVLRLGDEDPAVPILRARLALTGDLVARRLSGPAVRYDAVLEAAVRRAQMRLGQAVDGAVGPATRAALNVPAATRAQQIALNMERWRWLPADLGVTHLHVNAAGMWTELIEDGERALRLRTIVGTRGNPTPGFSSLVTHAVFSPYWNVPESIADGEIRPRLARDPGYLARHHMYVLPNGRIRQDPGPDNPLGPVKFIFENRFGVRLHGTSNPALFEERVRAFSHGCIRVEEPLRLAIRLVRGAGWDEGRIRAVVDQGDEHWVALPEPVPLHVAYWTTWVEDDGTVQFRDDLYGRDRALLGALGGLASAARSVPAAGASGSIRASLRPRYSEPSRRDADEPVCLSASMDPP